MRDLRWRTTIFALLLSLSLPLALGGGEDESAALTSRLRLLEDEFFFVRKFDRCYAELEAAVRRERTARGDSASLSDLHRRILLAWGAALEARGERDAALERYLAVFREGPDASGYREAGESAARLARELGEAAEDDAKALAFFRRAKECYEALGEADRARELLGRIIDLLSAEGLRAYRAREYGRAFDLLSGLAKDHPEGLGGGEAARVLADLRENTGVLRIRFLPVKADGVSVASGARIRLSPRGTGEAAEVPARGELRWRVGDYELSLVVPDAAEPLLTRPLRLRPGGAEVALPEKIPPGMVYVPAGQGTGAFFIDRTEVTVAEYRKVVPAYRPRFPGDRMPAHGISFAAAKAYAARVGKRLPTLAEWKRAAFGGGNARYPWGSESPKGRCNIGTGKPSEVGSYPEGRSPYGLLDMAGNVWEWLRDGYAIGGGYRRGMLEFQMAGWRADFLRDPRPDESVYNRGGPEFRRKYQQYKMVKGNLVEVGFRCVIEL